MSEPTRPLPRLDDPDTAEFWRRTSDGQLCYQQCGDCSALIFYPRRHCTSCGSQNLDWQQATGDGVIYTFSVVRQSYHPFFRSQLPYAIAWVDLDEGVRILSNILLSNIGGVADPGSELSIGQRVRVDWEIHEELAIPLFRPN